MIDPEDGHPALDFRQSNCRVSESLTQEEQVSKPSWACLALRACALEARTGNPTRTSLRSVRTPVKPVPRIDDVIVALGAVPYSPADELG